MGAASPALVIGDALAGITAARGAGVK